MSILPEAAINILPFSEEALSQWNQETDISQFLNALHAGTIYASYGQHLYKEGRKKFLALAEEFTKRAQRLSDIPNFLEDAIFGKVAKYALAWNGCVSDLLAESAFYSLEHILESDNEVECSLLLASHLYYKQALQVLRSFIEELILPINFCENVQEFDLWKASCYHTPPLRGHKGLIKKLVVKRILPDSLGIAASDLYSNLNSYIHGSENRLNYKGIYNGTWNGLIFKYKDFCEWAEYFSRSIDLGIRLLRTNYLQWESILFSKWNSLRSQGKILCSTCHNEDDFEVSILQQPADASVKIVILNSDGQLSRVDESQPETTFYSFRCRRCGHSTTVGPLP